MPYPEKGTAFIGMQLSTRNSFLAQPFVCKYHWILSITS